MVGIIVLTRIPNGELAVVLQRRGIFNFEKTKRENYPGCCQVTAHGGLKDGEDFYEGLIRESQEELGKEFTQLCKTDTELFELVHDNNLEREVITYGAFVAWERIKLIRLLPESGGIDIVPQSEIDKLIEITKSMKETGCPPSVRALFKDEIDAIKKTFETVSVNC